MRAHFGLPSVSNEEDKKDKPPITVKFEIPYFTVSGIQVRYLKIIEKSGYQVRCPSAPLPHTSRWMPTPPRLVAIAWAGVLAGAALGAVHYAGASRTAESSPASLPAPPPASTPPATPVASRGAECGSIPPRTERRLPVADGLSECGGLGVRVGRPMRLRTREQHRASAVPAAP